MPAEKSFEDQIATAVRSLRRKDKKLAGVIKKVCKLSLPAKTPNSYETLVQIIVGQQLSGKAAATIFGRVKKLAKGKALTTAFVKKLPDTKLQEVGVSRPKIKGIRSLTEFVETGKLRLRRFPHMSNEEVFDAIVQVKGLGPWSAQMYLMFVLRRLDVFPPGDLGIRKAIAKTYGGDPDEAACEKIAERWRPYRTVACMYLWRSLDNRPEVD
jgi:DNA-3-methyladenine glycosylase II